MTDCRTQWNSSTVPTASTSMASATAFQQALWNGCRTISSRRLTTQQATTIISIAATTTTSSASAYSNDTSGTMGWRATLLTPTKRPTRCTSRQKAARTWKTSTRTTPSTNTSVISNTGYQYAPRISLSAKITSPTVRNRYSAPPTAKTFVWNGSSSRFRCPTTSA